MIPTTPNRRTTMNRLKSNRCSTYVLAALAMPMFAPAALRADVVTDWNLLMQQTVIVAPSNPNLQTRWGAIVQLAVFEAVNSITGDYVPYLGTIVAPPGASPEAAAIAASHRTLVTLRSNLSQAILDDLDLKRATSLAAIPDSQAKIDGIEV